MINVLLVNPGRDVELAIQEPLNLGYLASYLKKQNIGVTILDEACGQDFYDAVKQIKPDFIGFSATTLAIKRAYELSDYCRNKGITTIIGGRHVSIYPEEGLKHADYIVVGEGELALLSIVTGNEKKGIVKKDPLKNLDDLPIIDRSLIDMNFYVKTKDRFQDSYLTFVPLNTLTAGIITSRGCPYNCIFCFNSYRGYPYRFHSAKRVVDEIKYLLKEYQIQAIFFLDDNLFANRSRLIEICNLIKQEKLSFIWGANSRVDNLDEASVIAAKEAGCKQITFGFESGSQKILNILNKQTTVEKMQEAVALVKKHGLLVTGTFMIGNPKESKADINLTKQFIQNNKIDSYGICITTPYPGTKLFEICQTQGLLPSIDKLDWSKFAHSEFPYYLSTNTLSLKEIKKAYYSLTALRKRNDQLKIIVIIRFLLFHPKKFIEYLIYSPGIIFDSLGRIIPNNKR